MTATLDRLDAALRSASDPSAWVAQAVAETRARCAVAISSGDVVLAVEAKAGAEATHLRVMRDRLPREVLLTASTAVRYAERAIGVTIRAGQDAGRIRKQGDNRTNVPGPADLAGTGELSDFYAMADDVPDAMFEDVLRTAKTEQNTGRAHVLRLIEAQRAGVPDRGDWIPDPLDRSTEAQVRRRELVEEYAGKGWSSRQIAERTRISEPTVRKIAEELGIEIRADRVVGRTRRADSGRVAAQTANSLDGLVTALDLIAVADLTAGQRADLRSSLTDATAAFADFAKKLNS